jgi:quercetin dioxygenase-like cupin family protein
LCGIVRLLPPGLSISIDPPEALSSLQRLRSTRNHPENAPHGIKWFQVCYPSFTVAQDTKLPKEDYMATQIFDVKKLKKFNDEKRHKEDIWSDDKGTVTLLCLKPGQEVITHTHHGAHIWTIMEGEGQLLTGKEPQTITPGQIVVVPALENHGIRNASTEDLVIVSITTAGD